VSVTKQTTIWCDGKTDEGHSCMVWVQVSDPPSRIRQRLKREGWTRGPDGDDYCPVCSKKRAKESSTRKG